MSENKEKKSGIGFGTILFLIFLVLKLGGWGIVATWPWIWVFSPIWIPLLFVFIVFIIFYIINSL
jgi:hypothetical protein